MPKMEKRLGGLAERSKAPVLKTGRLKGRGGSNPSSADNILADCLSWTLQWYRAAVDLPPHTDARHQAARQAWTRDCGEDLGRLARKYKVPNA